jgi:hypothetical protein
MVLGYHCMRITTGLVLVASTGCFASNTSVAHDMFVAEYGCPTAEESEDGDIVDVVGCNHHQQFACSSGFNSRHHDSQPTTCSYRPRVAYVASDGTQRIAWQEDKSIVYDTAMASAAHDLPCSQSAIKSVDNLTLEGCGQRVTYREVRVEVELVNTVPGDFRVTLAYRYVLVGRVPLATSQSQ